MEVNSGSLPFKRPFDENFGFPGSNDNIEDKLFLQPEPPQILFLKKKMESFYSPEQNKKPEI
jgi:hypothetical protein